MVLGSLRNWDIYCSAPQTDIRVFKASTGFHMCVCVDLSCICALKSVHVEGSPRSRA